MRSLDDIVFDHEAADTTEALGITEEELLKNNREGVKIVNDFIGCNDDDHKVSHLMEKIASLDIRFIINSYSKYLVEDVKESIRKDCGEAFFKFISKLSSSGSQEDHETKH